MRKSILVALVVATVIVAACGIFFASRIRAVSADLAQRVESQTGMHVASSGLPGISFWPRFSISLGNVVIPGAGGADSTPLATVATLRIVPAGGLFGFGGDGIAEIVLDQPNINLVVGSDGRANWSYAKAADDGDPKGLPLRFSNGRIAFLDERSGSATAVVDVEGTAELAGPADAMNARGTFVWNDRRASFTLFLKSPRRVAEDGSPADVTLEAPGLEFQFSGRAAVGKGFELAGQSRIKGTDLSLAASWFDATLPDGMNGARFELAGPVESKAEGLAFTDAQFALDDMHGDGDIALSIGRNGPKLEAKARIGTIDLTRYRAALAGPGPAFLSGPWSSKRVDLSALRTLDARLDVSANVFAYGAFRTGPASINATLQNGVLDFRIARASYAGGTLDLSLILDGAAETPAFEFTANGEGLAAETVIASAFGFPDLKGKLSPSLSVNARGKTQEELIATLKGEASFRIVDGTIQGVDLPAAFTKVSNSILEGWGRDDRHNTSFDAVSATFKIADGIAATTNLILTSPALSFTAKGEIDLLRKALDLKVDPRIPLAASTTVAPQFANFPVAILVKGPWTKPRIYPDMPGILEDPAGAYAALKKLGLGSSD